MAVELEQIPADEFAQLESAVALAEGGGGFKPSWPQDGTDLDEKENLNPHAAFGNYHNAGKPSKPPRILPASMQGPPVGWHGLQADWLVSPNGRLSWCSFSNFSHAGKSHLYGQSL
ncbi:hypothetical protein WJX74_005428 [Apatococcus lobatus]|uniref:Uncharacterized protein n=1 Tax=Apatococcus lobatus TaxID=904363 RepID=A0AAW1S5R9_9CHLO